MSSTKSANHHSTDATGQSRANKATWGVAAALLVSPAVYFVAQFLGGFAASYVSLLTGDEEAFLGTTTYQFLFVVFAEALTIGAIIQYVRYRRGTLRMLGLTKPRLNDAFAALVGFFIYFGLYIGVALSLSQLFPGFDLEQEQDVGFNDVTTVQEQLLTFLSLVVIVPIAEEILFRGFLFAGLRKTLSFVPSMLVTSLIFALGHLPSGVGGLLWIGALDTFLLSIVLCNLREKTGSVWAGTVVHAIKNGIAFVFLYLVVV